MIFHQPRRRFGQNFLVDPSYIARIVQALAPHPQDRVAEIGPGLGALTAPLLEHLRTLDVVEIDRDLAARLRESYPSERLRVHQADALTFDFARLGPDLRLVGNLPYNVSSPLLFRMIELIASLRDCHFMLQREVVDRIVAQPGGRIYGRLSVMLQYRFHTEKLFEVPAGAFRPAPQVDSAMVRLTPHRAALAQADDERLFSAIVARAFTQRRKTVRNALADFITAHELSGLGIDPGLRPERLSLQQFVRIANAIAAREPAKGGQAARDR